jgi:hypothetical protein
MNNGFNVPNTENFTKKGLPPLKLVDSGPESINSILGEIGDVEEPPHVRDVKEYLDEPLEHRLEIEEDLNIDKNPT